MKKTIQGKSVFINKKISNITNSFKSIYIIGVLFVLLSFAITYLLTNYYLQYTNKQRKHAFIEGYHQGVTKLILKDLRVIFDESQSLNNLAILTNYTEIKNIKDNSNIIGNVLYVTREKKSLIFDLSLLNSLLINILEKDFYYKIIINDQLLITNSNSYPLSYRADYKIIDNQAMSLFLEFKDTSVFAIKNKEIIQKQNTLLIILHVIVFFSASILVIYAIKFWKKSQHIKKKIQSIELIHKRNIKYLEDCNNLLGREKLPIPIPNVKNVDNKINVHELIEEIQIITEAYIMQYHYKYKLDITAGQGLITLPINSIAFKQIIISLIYNLLYFMRGGNHVKQFVINILDDSITMQYDSFAAREEHMCNWSNGLFQHLGNPYILDCKKIFEQIKKLRLEYQINACQGQNKIIINLKEPDANNKIIQFKKNI